MTVPPVASTRGCQPSYACAGSRSQAKGRARMTRFRQFMSPSPLQGKANMNRAAPGQRSDHVPATMRGMMEQCAVKKAHLVSEPRNTHIRSPQTSNKWVAGRQQLLKPRLFRFQRNERSGAYQAPSSAHGLRLHGSANTDMVDVSAAAAGGAQLSSDTSRCRRPHHPVSQGAGHGVLPPV